MYVLIFKIMVLGLGATTPFDLGMTAKNVTFPTLAACEETGRVDKPVIADIFRRQFLMENEGNVLYDAEPSCHFLGDSI